MPRQRPRTAGTAVDDGSTSARDGLASVTRGTLVMMIGTLGFVVESFVTRVLLFRVLTIDQWSQFYIGLTIAGLLSATGSLGLPQAIARCLPFESDQAERRRMVRTSFSVLVPSAITVAAFMAFLSLPLATTYQSPLLAETLLFFAVATAIGIVGTLVAAIFQGYEDVIPNALFVQVINPSLFISFLLIADGITPLRLAYTATLVAYAISAMVTILALGVYTRYRLPKLLPPGPRTPGLSRKLLVFAQPLFIVTALGFVAGNIDALVLGAYDRTSVGYYSADLSLARLIQVGIGSLSYIILPVTTRFVRMNDLESVRTTYSTATKWMTVASLPLFLLFFFDPVGSLTFVYGPGSAVDATALQILLAGALASTLVGPSTATQVSFGQTRLLLYNTIISAGVDVALSVALVPFWGVTGAAVAWTASVGLYPILSMIELAYLANVHPFRRHYLVPFLATAIPVALLLTFAPFGFPVWTLPLIVVAIALLFALLVLVTGSLDHGDRLLLEAVESVLGRRVPFVRTLGRWFMRPENPPAGVPPGLG
jgi:O-antigen/teichoic acid export membrane protein